jgi:two-component system, OmpR family, phosphate regulon response regulator PhoB
MRRQIAISEVNQVPVRSQDLAAPGKATRNAGLHEAIALARFDPPQSSSMQAGRHRRAAHELNPSPAKPLILLAGETGFISLLKYVVEDNGYDCILADDVAAAPAIAAAEHPDLIALDVIQVQGCDAVRQKIYQDRSTRHVPVLIMTATSVHPDQLASQFQTLFMQPANVIVKPFLPEAFLERVHDLLRQTSSLTSSGVLRFADIVMELEAHRVYRGGRAISLTPIEYRILRQLLEHPRKVLTRDRIRATVHDEADAALRSIDVHISRIRKALCGHGEPNHIRTVRGIGYSVDAASDISEIRVVRSHSARAGG